MKRKREKMTTQWGISSRSLGFVSCSPTKKIAPSTLLFRLLPFAQIPFLGDEIDDDDDDDDDDNTAVEEEKV
jgi:hypothetical protein